MDRNKRKFLMDAMGLGTGRVSGPMVPLKRSGSFSGSSRITSHGSTLSSVEKEIAAKKSVNNHRRSFLKWLAIGGGSFVLWKIFDFGFKWWKNPDDLTKETLFENFRITETGKNLTISERSGKEIIVIEKD